MLKILTKGKAFMDTLNRERIFHGINMVYKGDFDEESGIMNYIAKWGDTEFKWLKDNGFNIIRLGIIWDGVEHEMSVYDETYLDWIDQILTLCDTYEIYAFLDMHQDLFSCLYGDGAPAWATITNGHEHTVGNLWSDAYLSSAAVNTAYYNFWLNTKAPDGQGLQDHYANMWAHIVRKFKDHKSLIGFDFINEPFPGEHSQDIFGTLLGAYAQLTHQDITPEELMTSFSDPHKKYELLKAIDDTTLYTAMTQTAKELLSGFDEKHLASFYRKMTEAVREVTSEGIIMLENSYFSNMGIECSIPPIIQDGYIEPLQAYAPHGYDLVVDTPDIVNASNNRVTTIFNAHKRVQDRLNIPVLVGEWGAHSKYKDGLYHLKYLLNYYDNNKWSHTYWCHHEHIENAPLMDVLRRPYPQAVSGSIISYSYNYDTCTFELTWDETMSQSAPTDVYLPTKPQSIEIDGSYTIQRISEMSDALILIIPHSATTNRKLIVTF